ncbi:MAG: ABC transporter ATP-binding protein [Candidatus Omnitrophica bacterium]|nr:ABC transporter ATP-binding protein [Candidatus Omnitrophota bacterium]MCM8798388.1 ABC transporter ATP-binding protein [Candidatus Omnitrophota bacterium]
MLENAQITILEVKDLKKFFPLKRGLFYKTVGYIKAVDGVSFSLRQGKTLGIVGESGSGKSTLAKLLIKILEPDAGEIFFRDKEITSLPEREFRKLRKSLSIVFQDPFSSLDPRFTVEKIILEGMELLKENKAEKRKRVFRLLEMVGLSYDALERFPHEFSGGQRQRISIARALASEPELVILDEPVSSLDLSIQAQMINLLIELQEKLKLSYIFIAHDLRVIRHLSDEVCVMYRGKILERAFSEEIFQNPLHPYTQTLFSSIPFIGKKTFISQTVTVEEEKPEDRLCRFLPRCGKKKTLCEENEPFLKEVLPHHFVSCWQC